jgi:hypothetical protein
MRPSLHPDSEKTVNAAFTVMAPAQAFASMAFLQCGITGLDCAVRVGKSLPW